MLVRVLESVLEHGEKTGGAWDGKGYEPEFANDFFPLLLADAPLASEVVEEGCESGLAVVGKLKGLAQSVDNPA